MTLEELKDYRAKCEEVQSTIKRDIAYIEKDIEHREYCKLRGFDDFVGKVKELFQYLPTFEELSEVRGCACWKDLEIKGREVYISFSNGSYSARSWWRFLVSWKYDSCSRSYRGVCISTDGDYCYDLYSEEEKPFKLWVADNAEELYNLLIGLTAEVNKAYNNALIRKNKELLDKAEELHN